MNDTSRLRQTLGALEKKAFYLKSIMSRLFPQGGNFSLSALETVLATPEGVARPESFVGKPSRMQDTLVDKPLPRFLLTVGEQPGTALDNLHRMERLGLIEQAETWFAARRLRNRLVHEYVDDPAELAAALETARKIAADLLAAYRTIKAHVDRNLPASGA